MHETCGSIEFQRNQAAEEENVSIYLTLNPANNISRAEKRGN